ncbi:acetyl-CoA C-acetyltransferase [Corynebacterium sp. S7]
MNSPHSDANQARDDVVIVGAARTPFGKMLGALSTIPATDLAAVSIRQALGTINGHDVDAVIMGQVLQAGVGQNPAKQAASKAGISRNAHTTTVNKVCLSGLTAIIDAARLIRAGEANIVVAGGMENMSLAPHLLIGARSGFRYGPETVQDHMDFDGLQDAEAAISMGALSEKHQERYPVSREEQDCFAAVSHQRASQAHESGEFSAELAPVTVVGRKGKQTVVDHDEGVRPDTTAEVLAGLKPAFSADGTITAGNSAQISDGAAATVLSTRGYAEANGLEILATLRAVGQVAGPDASLQSQPAHAIDQALKRQGWRVEDLDVVEINEAFANVSVFSARELGIDLEKINDAGGACSIGHPIGASGARLVVHAAHLLARRGGGKAAVSLCGGGGQGEALLLEA